jgi:peptide/nickel transport system substrate-binding protein
MAQVGPAVSTILVITVVGAGGCLDGGSSVAEPAPWSLDPSLAESGAGIPFCEESTARVAAFMSRFEGQTPPSGRHGGTVVVGVPGEMSGGLNAHLVGQNESMQHQIFVNLMTLVRYDPDLNPTPYLARSWDVSPDGTELTFHLRGDVYWHDGQLTDAYDVAYTFERATDPETGFPNDAWWTFVDRGAGSVEVIDSLTVRFRMTPHADFLDPWTMLAIMPSHLLEDVPATELRAHPYGSVCPVGNGPFIFVSHRQDASWTFQANPAFPEELGGRPYVDRYVYRSVTDQTTLLTELLTENLDVYVSPTPDQAASIIESDALDLYRSPTRQIVLVAWNSRRPQLADKRVRLAITKAINRPEIVAGLFQEFGVVSNSTVPSFHWAYEPSLGAAATAFDPDAAGALLDEAGWIDRDGDGVRENAAGLPLSFGITFNPNLSRQSVAVIMQAQLADIGIQVVPTEVDVATWAQQLTDSRSRDFDGVMVGWVTDLRLDDTGLFHSERVDGPLGWSGTQRPDIDHYLERLPLILDRQEAESMWAAYQELLVDEQPFTFLYQLDRLAGVNRRIQNVVMDVRGDWVNLKEWWIPSDQRRRGAP